MIYPCDSPAAVLRLNFIVPLPCSLRGHLAQNRSQPWVDAQLPLVPLVCLRIVLTPLQVECILTIQTFTCMAALSSSVTSVAMMEVSNITTERRISLF